MRFDIKILLSISFIALFLFISISSVYDTYDDLQSQSGISSLDIDHVVYDLHTEPKIAVHNPKFKVASPSQSKVELFPARTFGGCDTAAFDNLISRAPPSHLS